MKVVRTHRWLVPLVAVIGLAMLAGAARPALAATAGRWLPGDLDTHTWLGNGSNTQGEVLNQAFNNYGLSYVANADPGGVSTSSPIGAKFLLPIPRWTSLGQYSYPQIMYARSAYPGKSVIQALDWNVPGRDSVNVGIVGPEQPAAIANFEYLFDNADVDNSRVNEGTKAITHTEYHASGNPVVITDVPATTFFKQNGLQVDPVTGAYLLDTGGKPLAKDATGKLTDELSAVQWLEDNYSADSYAIVNHPSMSLAWTAQDLRMLTDAAPDVVLGMVGIPGHQAEVTRGLYANNFDASGAKTSDPTLVDAAVTAKARTYGGADYMLAKVGGVWDSLLSEGRHFWVFGNSDYKSWNSNINNGPAGPTQAAVGKDWHDYYPGQYTKTWTYVTGKGDENLVSSLASGNSYITEGDLITGLDFRASYGKTSHTMGQTLSIHKGQSVTITIRFHRPSMNNNGDKPVVNHIDVIEGATHTPATQYLPGTTNPNPLYAVSDVTSTTKVVKRFTKANWHLVNGWMVMSFTMRNVQHGMYFRLRGSDLGLNVTNYEQNGNPVIDTASYTTVHDPAFPNDPTKTLTGNTVDLPWNSLWFYSNPIFVNVH